MIPTRPQVLARLQLRRLNLNKISTAGSQAQRAAASQATNAYEHTNYSEACWIAAFGGLTALATGVAAYNKTTAECQEMLHKPPPADAPSVGMGPAKNIMLHRLRSVRARDMTEKYKVTWDKVLGEGAYGAVYPAYHIQTGEKVALKKISKRFTNSKNFKTETDALLRIFDNGGHPNISGLRDMYEDFDHFYLILDLVKGGEMFDHLVNYGPYSEADAARLMQEVASALAFLHGVGVVHADLKPENLLICSTKTSDGTIKMIDFGSAVVNHDNYHDDDDDDDDDETNFLRGRLSKLQRKAKDMEMRPEKKMAKVEGETMSTGTTAYWSPERFRVKGAEPAGDMWAVGVILFIMLTGVHPFDLQGMSTDEEIENRLKTDPIAPITPRTTGHLSESAIKLIKMLMEPDPMKRLSANGMLRHPWIRGDTASKKKMMDSDKKLMKFKDLRHQLEAGIFSVLVSQSVDMEERAKNNPSNSATANIIKKAFEVFDAEGKGFVTGDDLGTVIRKVADNDEVAKVSGNEWEDLVAASTDDENEDAPTANGSPAMSLSDFTNVFAGMRRKHFPKGHVVLRHGDKGDSMYFINSGKVEVTTRTGKLVGILRSGSFFGEGSLLDPSKTRSATVKCVTPVDVIEITRDDFDKFINFSTSARRSLKVASQARKLQEAKNIIRFNTNVKIRVFEKGAIVYKEGDVGNSMYFVDEVDGGTFDVLHSNEIVHRYHSGDSFGESSLLFKKPRSSTVICASEHCKVHEMSGPDFLELVESYPETARFLRDMCSKRLLKKAIGIAKVYSRDDLRTVFDAADADKSGAISVGELTNVMKSMDPDFPDEDIASLMKAMDLDEDGAVSFEEFARVFHDVGKNKARWSL
mmetsp:Transcript_3436/g.5370  ORF Transcript_3436/g.5370 Transcript_3436/m.5370 type:complete len:866 (+) Transcript_3436:173-2770(+)